MKTAIDHNLQPVEPKPWAYRWEESDAQKTLDFFNSKTGQRLVSILKEEGILVAPTQSVYREYAHGYNMGCWNTVERMKQIGYAPIKQYDPASEEDAKNKEGESFDGLGNTEG